ncbi:hypothetical protein C8R44DRAFT_745253 [Mycena epipterygia]|nr:hypothetical protein C8R44DRAFT_745253 [Mycena epipterygia]
MSLTAINDTSQVKFNINSSTFDIKHFIKLQFRMVDIKEHNSWVSNVQGRSSGNSGALERQPPGMNRPYICCKGYHYIRRMVDIDAEGFDPHAEDDPVALSESKHLRFILCMTVEGSERLLKAQYIQSDISFQRVVGFYELELGAWEHNPTTFVVFCRIFLNRQTAVAQLKIYQAIGEIVCADTITEKVKELMRILICVEHKDWDGTIQSIRDLGGKAGNDWVHDKERSQFAFQAMCWAKSSIRRLIYNPIETSHADINREDIQCTILGGIMKGEFYDTLQMKTLRVFEETGIRPAYSTGHPAENAVKNLKRKYMFNILGSVLILKLGMEVNIYQKGLVADDLQIWSANIKIRTLGWPWYPIGCLLFCSGTKVDSGSVVKPK